MLVVGVVSFLFLRVGCGAVVYKLPTQPHAIAQVLAREKDVRVPNLVNVLRAHSQARALGLDGAEEEPLAVLLLRGRHARRRPVGVFLLHAANDSGEVQHGTERLEARGFTDCWEGMSLRGSSRNNVHHVVVVIRGGAKSVWGCWWAKKSRKNCVGFCSAGYLFGGQGLSCAG